MALLRKAQLQVAYVCQSQANVEFSDRYFEHVKQPMDLSTMSHKLNAGMYEDRFAFRNDFKLMIANCYLYNGTESLAGKLGQTFDIYFDKQWERANATLEQLRLRAGFAAAEQVAPATTVADSVTSTAPESKSAPAEDHFVAPQPPALAASPAPAAPRPTFNLKLKLSTSGSSMRASPPQPTPATEQQTPLEPVKSTDNRQPSMEAVASPREIPRLSSTPREMSRGPSVPHEMPPLKSRSSSPAVPLAVAAPAAVTKPKIKFSTKPKAEPVDDEFVAPLPPSNPSPRPSPAPSGSVEPVQSKPKKIRLSLGGHGASSSQSPAPLFTPTPPPVTPAANGDHERSGLNGDHGRNGLPHDHRAQSTAASTGGDAHIPVNIKKMQALLRKIISMDESYFFRRPVDPIADGCPT